MNGEMKRNLFQLVVLGMRGCGPTKDKGSEPLSLPLVPVAVLSRAEMTRREGTYPLHAPTIRDDHFIAREFPYARHKPSVII